jgi:hypothetical protein
MIKRTIHLTEQADECLRKLYAEALQANEKTSFSKIISDALEEYYQSKSSSNGL